jgi:hypothetical protein
MVEGGRVEEGDMLVGSSKGWITMDRESLGKVRQATSIYLGRITNDALDETSGIGTFLDPILGSSDRRGDALDFGSDEGSIGMDALSVSFEIVQSGETAATVVVRTDMGLGSKRIVRLYMRLGISLNFNNHYQMTYL